MVPTTIGTSDAANRYLDLMKQCLTRYMFLDEEVHELRGAAWRRPLYEPLRRALVRHHLIVGRVGGSRADRRLGREWPPHAETMIGLVRLEHLQTCITDILNRNIPGDLVETGVWRGGASIFMRAVLAAFGDTVRRVWVADSFEGLPFPDPERYPADRGLVFHDPRLSVSLDQVKANFEKYGLLDSQVKFLKGWFKDTLPLAPIDQLAVVRLDGDLYESTTDALTALYPRLSIGGYLIVDDFGAVEACRKAVADYRTSHHISETIEAVDWTCSYWKKLR